MSAASRRVAKREAQLRADLKFLNGHGLMIVTTSTKQQVITRESIHAIAELLRALRKAPQFPREAEVSKCAFGDPLCPCQDGDPCHYVDLPDSPAMPPPPKPACTGNP